VTSLQNAASTPHDCLDRIETALQRVPLNLDWISDEGEPAMDALRFLRSVIDGIPDAIAQAAVIGAKYSAQRVGFVCPAKAIGLVDCPACEVPCDV
jgi:hypothetical protein